MRLSVVISTRNRAPQLAEALGRYDAIRTQHEWELIVVDNGSSDDTQAVIAAASARLPNMRRVYEARAGLGTARNAGWREARGEIVAFTDDDCYPEPDYVDALVGVFDEHPEIGFLTGQIRLWDPEDIHVTLDLRPEALEIAPYSFLPSGAVHGANFAFRRETLARIDGFDTRFGAGTRFPCEDIDAAAAASWRGIAGRYDPRVLVYHHHRRRACHTRRLWRQYDWGRGAYYMKYLLWKPSRRAYLVGWQRDVLTTRSLFHVRMHLREMVAAGEFLATGILARARAQRMS